MEIDLHKVLIILPAFNEGGVVADVVEQLKSQGLSAICVVNDGSTDDTAAKAKAAGAILITHTINRGAGAAVQTGLAYASKRAYSHAVLMDSDGQHLAKDIFALLAQMQASKADIVIGNRFGAKGNEVPGHRVLYNRIANVFTNLFCKNSYPDTQSGFRLLNLKAIQTLELRNRGFGFCSEMLIQADRIGLRIVFTPISVLYTTYSLSKGQNWQQGVKTARSILWDVLFKS